MATTLSLFGDFFAILETPLACYRIGFGPAARNRRNIGNSLPQKIGKDCRKIGKWPQNPMFEPIFLFRLFLYFLAKAVSYIFLFRAGGPKPIL